MTTYEPELIEVADVDDVTDAFEARVASATGCRWSRRPRRGVAAMLEHADRRPRRGAVHARSPGPGS